MKAIAFGIALAGLCIGSGIAETRRDMTNDENLSVVIAMFVLFLGIILS